MRTIQRDEFATLVFWLAIFLGLFVRFSPAWLAGFPVNDGGMFATMIDDLRANHYLLPLFTSYNGMKIPFAYPPLGFYLGGLVADIFQINSLEVVRWLPAGFASLSVPVFYFLARRLSKTRLHASVATLIFALVPRAFSWYVMGGGLARSPGQFFMLLTLLFVLRLYAEGKRRDLVLTGLFGALAVLSHPEAGVQAAISAVLFWLMLSRSRRTFFYSVFVAGLVLVFTSPWWVTVVLRHGIAPFLAAAQTGSKDFAIFYLLFFSFTAELYATLVAVLGMVGVGLHLARKEYLLSLWLLAPFLISGRSATNLAVLPLSILAATAWLELLSAAAPQPQPGHDSAENRLVPAQIGLFAYLAFYLTFSANQFAWQSALAHLPPEQREALAWVQAKTPSSARFLVLTGARPAFCDPLAEWFPALARRESRFTVQGTEWTLGNQFGAFLREAGTLQTCVGQDADCVLRLTASVQYDYIYLAKTLRSENCEPLDRELTFTHTVEGLRSNPRFETAYETPAVIIFRAVK